MRLLVTGGAGFIGSNYIRHRLTARPADQVLNLDALTYAGNLESLRDVERSCPQRYRFVHADICDAAAVDAAFASFAPDAVVHFAAESHNSRAVLDPPAFFRTNVLGTVTLLEAARRHKTARFHHVGTCEVFGELPLDSTEVFREDSPYRPQTPYNASKAAADHAVRAWVNTFGLPATLSICANNYGPYQFPEKVIPLFATNALDDVPLPLYKSSRNRREWLHVLDHCRALDAILERGRIGRTYNIGSGLERDIEQIADAVLALTGKPASLKTYVPDRPGHDTRYLLDHSRLERELGWKPEVAFEQGLAETVAWYKARRDWWEPLKRKAGLPMESAWAGRPSGVGSRE
jgi:dTDP-glucose 4,6-dehydratase